jgi:hypothetical protein
MTIAQDGVLLSIPEDDENDCSLSLELCGKPGHVELWIHGRYVECKLLTVEQMRELAKTLTEWAAIVEKRP